MKNLRGPDRCRGFLSALLVTTLAACGVDAGSLPIARSPGAFASAAPATNPARAPVPESVNVTTGTRPRIAPPFECDREPVDPAAFTEGKKATRLSERARHALRDLVVCGYECFGRITGSVVELRYRQLLG